MMSLFVTLFAFTLLIISNGEFIPKLLVIHKKHQACFTHTHSHNASFAVCILWPWPLSFHTTYHCDLLANISDMSSMISPDSCFTPHFFLLQHNTSLSIHSRHQLVQVPLQLAQLCSSLLESVVVSMEQHHTPSKCNTLCPPIIYIIKHQSSISIFQPFALTQPN